MRLKEIRKRLGITQVKMAMDLHLSQNSVSRYETGRHEPDLRTLVRIADYLNVSLDELVGREFPPNANH